MGYDFTITLKLSQLRCQSSLFINHPLPFLTSKHKNINEISIPQYLKQLTLSEIDEYFKAHVKTFNV